MTLIPSRGALAIGRLPGFRSIPAVIQAAHQLADAVAQPAAQTHVRRTHGNAEFAGPFAQANLNRALIFVRELNCDVVHAPTGGLVRFISCFGSL